jgi:hypothetical protein
MVKRPAPPPTERLGIRGYARHRKVSHTAVEKAIETGRLQDCLTRGTPSKRYPKGRVLIDPAVADQEWDRRTDATQQREKHRAAAAAPVAPTLFDTGTPDHTAALEDKGNGPPSPKAADANARRLYFEAKLAELRWQERAGELVHAERVQLHGTRAGQAIQQELTQLSARHAAELAAETNAARCREILDGAVERIIRVVQEAIAEPL